MKTQIIASLADELAIRRNALRLYDYVYKIWITKSTATKLSSKIKLGLQHTPWSSF